MKNKPEEVDTDLLIDEDMEEEEAYVTYDIASYPSDLTLSGIKEMWDNGDILVPEFQRNYVWKIQQASLLIESFLLGLPVPQVFFYIEQNNKSLVIDGQQRILSIVYFLEGYFKGENVQGRRQVFRLTGLDKRSPFANLRYEDLPENAQRKLRSSVLRAINIKQLSPNNENTSIYHIFERLNTGGTPLKPQEIRNCVFRGELVSAMRKLNKDKNWRKILGKAGEDAHQKDVELILRIFALSANGWKLYEKPMKEYLNLAMRFNRDGDSDKVKKFVTRFSKVTAHVVEQLGETPFHLRGPLNSSALDAVLCILIDNANSIPKDLANRYRELLKNKEFRQATYYGTSDVAVLHSRFNEARKYLIG